MAAFFFLLISIAQASDYFPSDYESSRSHFLQNTRNDWKQGSINIPSQIDSDLTIDHAYLAPSEEPHSLLILTSGVHGVEAFAGSAVQQLFLQEILPDIDRKNLGILLVHAMNPYGFKYLRRVTESNVDLNRNFGINSSHFLIKNPGYDAVESVLNPRSPLSLNSPIYYFSYFDMLLAILFKGMKPLRQAVLQGQYEFPQGLYFGGKKFERQNITVGRLIKKVAKPFKKILAIDIHTGYGANGVLHLFGDSSIDSETKKHTAAVFSGHKVDTGDDKDFYKVHGSFTKFIGKLVPKGAFFVPMTFEFGTLDSQTTTGALKSISNMIVENQGFHNGYKSEEDKKLVKDRIQEMYYPSDPEWREKVIGQSRKILKSSVANFQKL